MACVAVVVDDPDLAGIIADVLRDKGHDVISYVDSGDVIGHVQEKRPDLLIIDSWLDTPTMGLDIVDKLARDRRTKSVRVIVVSDGSRHFEDEARKLEQQGISVLAKPFDISALEDLVQARLAPHES